MYLRYYWFSVDQSLQLFEIVHLPILHHAQPSSVDVVSSQDAFLLLMFEKYSFSCVMWHVLFLNLECKHDHPFVAHREDPYSPGEAGVSKNRCCHACKSRRQTSSCTVHQVCISQKIINTAHSQGGGSEGWLPVSVVLYSTWTWGLLSVLLLFLDSFNVGTTAFGYSLLTVS